MNYILIGKHFSVFFPLVLSSNNVSGAKPGYFLGVGPNTVFRISVNVNWESTYPLTPGDESSPGRVVGTFPNYLNGYVPPNRVVILERVRLLRNSVCRVGPQSFFLLSFFSG